MSQKRYFNPSGNDQRENPRHKDRRNPRKGFNYLFGNRSDGAWRSGTQPAPARWVARDELWQRDARIDRERLEGGASGRRVPPVPDYNRPLDGFGGMQSRADEDRVHQYMRDQPRNHHSRYDPHHHSQNPSYDERRHPVEPHGREDVDAYTYRSRHGSHEGSASLQGSYDHMRNEKRHRYEDPASNFIPDDETARPRPPPQQFRDQSHRLARSDNRSESAPPADEEAFPRSPRVESRNGAMTERSHERSAFNPMEDNRPSKRKKFVPGGRIPKYEKAQEFDPTNLYCDFCEQSFFDVNAKALHDKSRKHQREVQFCRADANALAESRKAKESIPETEQPVIETVPKASNAENVARIFAGSKDVNVKNLPKAFKEWAARSLREAAKTAKEEGDASILQAVRQEILVEFQHHTKNFSILRESWDRRPSATGFFYKNSSLIPKDIVLSAEQSKKAEARIEKSTDDLSDGTRDEAAIPSSLNKESTSGDAESRWVSGGTEGRESTVRPLERVETLDMAATSRLPMVSTARPHSTGIDNDKSSLAPEKRSEQEIPEYSEMEESFKIPLQAKYMYYSSPTDGFKNTYRKLFSSRFAEIKEAARLESEKAKGSIDSVLEKYTALKRLYEDGSYEYNDFRQGLSEVIEVLERRGTRIGTVQRCLEMQICVDIDGGKFKSCNTPCEQLMKLYSRRGKISAGDAEYIGYWIVSLLFRSDPVAGKPTSRRQQKISRILALQARFRDIPKGSRRYEAVRSAIRVLCAVISNNHVSFFNIRNSERLHEKTNNRSRYIMDGLVSFVRERALVCMLRKSRISENVVYANPSFVPMTMVISQLGFAGESPEDEEEAFEEAKEFIEQLPGGYRISNRCDGGEVVGLVCESRITPVQFSENVDVEGILGWNQKTWGDGQQAKK